MLKKNRTQPVEASPSTRTGLPNLHLFEKNKEEIEHLPIKAEQLITKELILYLFEKNKQETEAEKEIEEIEEIEHPPIKVEQLITKELLFHLAKKNKEEAEGTKEADQITLVDPQISEESIPLSSHNSSLIHRAPSGSNGCVEWLTRCLWCGLSFPSKMTLG